MLWAIWRVHRETVHLQTPIWQRFHVNDTAETEIKMEAAKIVKRYNIIKKISPNHSVCKLAWRMNLSWILYSLNGHDYERRFLSSCVLSPQNVMEHRPSECIALNNVVLISNPLRVVLSIYSSFWGRLLAVSLCSSCL